MIYVKTKIFARVCICDLFPDLRLVQLIAKSKIILLHGQLVTRNGSSISSRLDKI